MAAPCEREGGRTSQDTADSTLPGSWLLMLREELDTCSDAGCSWLSALQAEPGPCTHSLVLM